MIKLSERLKRIAHHIPLGSRFADIGSDHAYLCSHVCLNDPTAFAIAGEVREGPFTAAKKTIHTYQLQNNIQVRLGDGLEVMDELDQLDTIVIAGMGGKLISEILQKDKEKLKFVNQLILQPNTNAELVRTLLIDLGFSLLDEEILEENQHIYEILIATKQSTEAYNSSVSIERQIYFGPLLMKKNSPVFRKKWLLEHEHTTRILQQIENSNNDDSEIKTLLEKRKKWMEEILK